MNKRTQAVLSEFFHCVILAFADIRCPILQWNLFFFCLLCSCGHSYAQNTYQQQQAHQPSFFHFFFQFNDSTSLYNNLLKIYIFKFLVIRSPCLKQQLLQLYFSKSISNNICFLSHKNLIFAHSSYKIRQRNKDTNFLQKFLQLLEKNITNNHISNKKNKPTTNKLYINNIWQATPFHLHFIFIS